MDEKPPILDYNTPEPQERKKPVVTRLMLGVFGAFATVGAAGFLILGFIATREAIGNARYGDLGTAIAYFPLALICTVAAYFLWKAAAWNFLSK